MYMSNKVYGIKAEGMATLGPVFLSSKTVKLTILIFSIGGFWLVGFCVV